jgi:hypothetical protein
MGIMIGFTGNKSKTLFEAMKFSLFSSFFFLLQGYFAVLTNYRRVQRRRWILAVRNRRPDLKEASPPIIGWIP